MQRQQLRLHKQMRRRRPLLLQPWLNSSRALVVVVEAEAGD
jgi:hypothetical protein